MMGGLRWLGLTAALCCSSRIASAQDTTAADSAARRPAGHFHVGLTIHDVGISYGNAPRVTGVRVNVQDAALEHVNGVNLTLWKPREPFSGTVNGLQAGVLPGSETVNGVAIGVAGVVTERHARWVTIGGLATVSNGAIDGVAVGGLGLVANGSVRGIGVGGLGAVANRDMDGVVVGGLGTVADGAIRGIAVAGLGTVANRDVTGLGVAGLGLVANGAMRGVAVGGLATVANGSISGLGIGGLAVVTDRRLTGLGVAGLAVVASDAVRGVAVAGYSVDTHELKGFSVSAYNRVRGLQAGMTIGIYNSADALRGVQIGVINRAKNNKAPFKILPIVNVHL
ncbi:MAG TPA: hypothetical protein VM716_15175 [Gemmatimonadales bacterium]|nr:hypothetical protein [Gemmatimonadales bacterium]